MRHFYSHPKYFTTNQRAKTFVNKTFRLLLFRIYILWLHIYLLYTIDLQTLCFVNFFLPIINPGKVSSKPAHSEILQKTHENQTTYVCLIEKFYPEFIRVTWTDEAHNKVTENVVQGDPWKATEEGEYSISTWLTVSAANKDKNYHCKYEHESKEHSLQTQGTYYMLKISFYVLLQTSLFL